jgi:hypothetical protein
VLITATDDLQIDSGGGLRSAGWLVVYLMIRKKIDHTIMMSCVIRIMKHAAWTM